MTAAETKNKLVRSITEEQLQEFLARLANTVGVDGPMIREEAEKCFGVRIGNDSANQFRKEVFGRYLEQLRKQRELSRAIADHRDPNAGQMIADAASEALQQQVFEFLYDNKKKFDFNDKDEIKRAEGLSRIIEAARKNDRALIDQLHEQLEAAKKREKETAEDLGNKALSDEERAARMRARFGVK